MVDSWTVMSWRESHCGVGLCGSHVGVSDVGLVTECTPGDDLFRSASVDI